MGGIDGEIQEFVFVVGRNRRPRLRLGSPSTVVGRRQAQAQESADLVSFWKREVPSLIVLGGETSGFRIRGGLTGPVREKRVHVSEFCAVGGALVFMREEGKLR